MSRHVVTAADVLAVVNAGGTQLTVEAGSRLTPLARDLLRDKGIRLVESASAVDTRPTGQAVPSAGRGTELRRVLPPLVHRPGAATMPLDAFPVDLGRPEMDVRATDVVTSRDGLPMSAGVMSLREGSFPWTLDYDEVEYVLEGELHITRDGHRVIGRPGDVIAVPRGSSITFGTPSWARFLYVTHPADWSSS